MCRHNEVDAYIFFFAFRAVLRCVFYFPQKDFLLKKGINIHTYPNAPFKLRYNMLLLPACFNFFTALCKFDRFHVYLMALYYHLGLVVFNPNINEWFKSSMYRNCKLGSHLK